MGRTKLGYRLENLVKRLLNEFVIQDKTFKLSAPADVETIKRIFGNTLTPKQLSVLEKQDGICCLFVTNFVQGTYKNELEPDVKEKRKEYKNQAQDTIEALKPYLGNPIVEVWESYDSRKNVFGNNSIYVCCMFGLNESGMPNFVV